MKNVHEPIAGQPRNSGVFTEYCHLTLNHNENLIREVPHL